MADESKVDESMAEESMAYGACMAYKLGNIEISEKKKRV